jgi:hypothetical protein
LLGEIDRRLAGRSREHAARVKVRLLRELVDTRCAPEPRVPRNLCNMALFFWGSKGWGSKGRSYESRALLVVAVSYYGFKVLEPLDSQLYA